MSKTAWCHTLSQYTALRSGGSLLPILLLRRECCDKKAGKQYEMRIRDINRT